MTRRRQEAVMHALVNIEARWRGADLAGIAALQGHSQRNRRIEVGVREYDEEA
jgi:hypothetical protein